MHKLQRCFLLALLGLTVFALPATADWNVGDPYKMHYPQLPDLTPTGMDILATVQGSWAPQPQWKILADDWRCTESGPVSDIHIWGSWFNDYLPIGGTGLGSPNNVIFKLSIHSDIPAIPGQSPSRPGDLLWSGIFDRNAYTVRPYPPGGTQPVEEMFYDPNIHAVVGFDHQVWQYNFTNIANPWNQQQGKIYWLDVQAMPLDTAAKFGWKTTNPVQTPHFMDDAVFADTGGFNGPLLTPWTPMAYESAPYQGQSIDMAFVITPEPGTVVMLVGAGLTGLGLLVRRRWRK
jgi:hypothetical protein